MSRSVDILVGMNKKSLFAIALATTASLSLAACGSSEEPQPATATADPTDTAVSSQVSESAESATSEETTSETQATGDDPVFAAIDAVLADYGDGVIVSIDREDNTENYDVDVVTGGQLIELNVNANTGDVMEEEREGDDDKVAKAQNVAVSVEEALEQALEQHADGVVDDVELEEDNGRLVWEISLDDQDRNDLVDLYIEAN